MEKFNVWLNGLEPGRGRFKVDLVISCARYCGCTRDAASRLISDSVRNGDLKIVDSVFLTPV